ncbi:hypothetical protein ACFQ0T_41750 [Kitasatospora gansuensis]
MTHPYIPNAGPAARAAMLAEIGASSVEEFYGDIPADLRLARPLDLPAPSPTNRAWSGTCAACWPGTPTPPRR